MMVDIRRDEYMALIEQIAALQRNKRSLEKEQEKLRGRIITIRAKCVLEIGTKKDGKGKLVYSNEQLREAALTLALDENQEFSELRDRVRTIQNEIYDIAIEYNKLIDQKYLLMIELGIPRESENEKYPDVH